MGKRQGRLRTRWPAAQPPSVPVDILFTHAGTSAGDLDACRTDHTPRTQAHVDRGYATVSFEIAGTSDCPAAPNDPESPDRLMSSVLDWVAASAPKHGFDAGKSLPGASAPAATTHSAYSELSRISVAARLDHSCSGL